MLISRRLAPSTRRYLGYTESILVISGPSCSVPEASN
jgi:hypothetical protein